MPPSGEECGLPSSQAVPPRDTPDARKFFKGWLCSGVSFGIANPTPCASIAFCDGLASYCQGGRVSDLISDLGSLPCHSF